MGIEDVKDFALSDNILTILTNKGEVYYAGLDKDFVPKRVKLMEG